MIFSINKNAKAAFILVERALLWAMHSLWAWSHPVSLFPWNAYGHKEWLEMHERVIDDEPLIIFSKVLYYI